LNLKASSELAIVLFIVLRLSNEGIISVISAFSGFNET
jgi:hypothetical protein